MPSTTTKSGRSRFSSPLHLTSSPASHNKGVATDGQRKFLQRWLEPPVQNKPSFQEAGLIRGGVLENMAPLGTLPKAAKKQAAASGEGTPGPAVKRIVVKRPAASATPVEELASMPQPAFTVESPKREFSSPTRPVFPVNGFDDDEDEDYTPLPKKSGRARQSSTGAGARPLRAGRRSTTARPKSPSPQPSSAQNQNVHTPDTIPSPSPAHVNEPDSAMITTFTAPASVRREPENKELVDRAVEVAVDEALQHFRFPTAWALRLLYDENSADPHFVSMVEDVFQQRADIETLHEFNRLVSARKKEGRIEDKGYHYFVPPTTANKHLTPHKPRAAPYHSLLTMDITPAKQKPCRPDAHVSKKQKTEGRHSIPVMDDEEDKKATSITNSENGDSGRLNGIKVHKSPHKSTHKSAHKSPHKSPDKAKKRQRSGSIDSESSLSSVPDEVDFEAYESFDDYMGHVDESLGVSRPSTAEPNNAPTLAGPSQPINGRQRKPPSKKKHASPKPDALLNAQLSLSQDPDPDMPAAIAVNGASHQHNTNNDHHNAKQPSRADELSDPRSLIQRKVKARRGTQVLTKESSGESFSRRPLSSDLLDDDVPTLAPVERPHSVRTPAPPLSLRAARAAKRHHENADESVSPTNNTFRADLELPSSTRSSRAATPSNLRTNKKPRTGLRVKTSPMKKKGTSAGIPRGSGERPSPVYNGASHDNNKDDNDDSCYTCGGSGELVCCDGCTYSFHFLCIDPPMDENQMPDDWFCNECMHKYFPAQFTGHKGAFGTLLDALDKKNPRAFRLPKEIRDHFEGVKTGADGEYEETASTKPKANKKTTEEQFDFYKVRSTEGDAVLCFQCNQGVTTNRPIIPCSVCGLNWHLECLDPPLAVPPVLRNWRCPCHVEDAFMANLAPAHKYRKIKNAPVIEQAYTRGMANNGWIEIEEDDDDDEPEETSHRIRRDWGRTYRLPERGIKLDFISRVREDRARAAQHRAASNPTLSGAPNVRSIEEQQAALNLFQLASSGDGASKLVAALISQAPPAAVSLMAQGDAANIAGEKLNELDHNALQAMLAQVDTMRTNIAKILENRGLDLATDRRTKKRQIEDSAMQMD